MTTPTKGQLSERKKAEIVARREGRELPKVVADDDGFHEEDWFEDDDNTYYAGKHD